MKKSFYNLLSKDYNDIKRKQEPWYELNRYGKHKNPPAVVVTKYIATFDLVVIIVFGNFWSNVYTNMRASLLYFVLRSLLSDQD